MKLIQTFALLVLLSTSLSASAAQGVYGNWKFPQFVSGPLVIDTYITITPSTMTTHSTCSMNGKIAVAEAVAPVSISPSQLSILAPAQRDVTIDGINCHASVQAGTMSYVVSPDDANLTLSFPGQGSMTFPRQ